MCTSNQERGCFLIEGRVSPTLASVNWRGAPHIFNDLSTAFFKKVEENNKRNLTKPGFTRLGDSESLLYFMEG